MFIHRNTKKVGVKTYHSILLMESYREGGKVKHHTLANLSSWPEQLIEGFNRLLKGERIQDSNLTAVKDSGLLSSIEYEQGKSCGGLLVIKQIADELGISQALGDDKNGQLALLLIMGRIVTQGSRLHLCNWGKGQAIEEVLGIKRFDEDDLYEALDWLKQEQRRIEDCMFKQRKDKEIRLFLYDVTSSYLEGECNELAEYGYNRDRKKGKKQIVIGMLTDEDGYPVSCEVFKGNTQDPRTVLNQVRKLSERFGVKEVTFVGDRGMIKGLQIEQIKSQEFHYITAITKPQIEKLITRGIFQLELFTEELAEIEEDGCRYLLRRNPERQKEIRKGREEKVKSIQKKVLEKNIYLKAHKRAFVEKGIRCIEKSIARLKLNSVIKVKNHNRELEISIDKDLMQEAGRLDGCYVIKTDLKKEDMDGEGIHNRYKDLFLIEDGFKHMKTGLLEVRPLYLRKEDRTRGHVFVTMLSLMITREIEKRTKEVELTLKEKIQALDKIGYNVMKIGGKRVKMLPAKLLSHQQSLIDKIGITLPRVFRN